MKIIFSMALALVAITANAQDIKIDGYDWTVTDIASRGLNKEDLYQRMDTKFIRAQKSICSNRALMWSQNFKRDYKLDTAKVFLFYTKKKARASAKTWWYHVAPAVNENGSIWMMDPGFPGFVDGPLTILDWAETMTGSRNCKEIKPNETELIERMFITQVFPHNTSYGWHDCYYIVTPHTLWTPETVAMSLLGKNSSGEPVHFSRPRIDKEEYFQACVEATTGKLGFFFGDNKEKCKKLAERLDW